MTPIYGGPVEKIEYIPYTPDIAGGADLEAATKTITNTSENAVADYTSIHTLPAPGDSRIAVLRGAMRLLITVDSVGGGCTTLNYRVKRGGVSVATGSFAVAGAPVTGLISWDITTLITGAQTNTLFLWNDAGTCVLSVVTMWTAIGSMAATRVYPCLSIAYAGQLSVSGYGTRVGSGTYACNFMTTVGGSGSNVLYGSGTGMGTLSANTFGNHNVTPGVWVFFNTPTVATDLPYINGIYFYLKAIQ